MSFLSDLIQQTLKGETDIFSLENLKYSMIISCGQLLLSKDRMNKDEGWRIHPHTGRRTENNNE